MMFHSPRDRSDSSKPVILAAIEAVVTEIEKQETVTSNDIQECIEKLRKSLRGLRDLTKQEWLALYEFGMRLHSIALNNMEKPDPVAILDTAVIAGRILEAFVSECQESSPSERAKAIEFGAWLSLTAAATHHSLSSFSDAARFLDSVSKNLQLLRHVGGISCAVLRTLEKQYLFHLLENNLSLEMIANFNTEQSEALNVVACIHQLLSEKGSDGPYDDGDDDGDDDDEYSLKVGMVCFSASGRCFANEPPAIQKARQWAKEAELLFRAVATRRATVLPEHSSVLLLLAKCCIRAGKVLNDTQALEEAIKCAEEVIQIGSDIEHGKLLQIQALILLERWDVVSKLVDDEICDASESRNGQKIRKWLAYVSFIVDSQQWDLANALYQKILSGISQTYSQQSDADGRKLLEDVQFTWAVTAAQQMKDLKLAGSIVDDLISAEEQAPLIDSRRVFKLCLGITQTFEQNLQNSDDQNNLLLDWLQRGLKFAPADSHESARILFRICICAIKSRDIVMATKFLSQLRCQNHGSSCNILRAAIVDFHLCLHKGDTNGAEITLKTALAKPHGHQNLDGTPTAENAEYLHLLSRATSEVYDSQNLTLAKTCICSIVDGISECKNEPEGLYIDQVFCNYIYIVSGKANNDSHVPEDIRILSQGLRIIDRFGVSAFASEERRRSEVFAMIADFAWNCAIQAFQFQMKSTTMQKDFGDVARAFHFSAEYRMHSLTEEKWNQETSNISSDNLAGNVPMDINEVDSNGLNEVNLSFFLAAASYLLNFRDGTKDQADLLSARTSLKMINKIRGYFNQLCNTTTNLTEMKLEFEIVSLVMPRTRLEEKYLQDIASGFIKAVSRDSDSLLSTKSFETLYGLCRTAFERQAPAQTTSLLCQKALDMLVRGVEADKLAEFDLRGILVSGLDINSNPNIHVLEDIVTIATKNPSYPFQHIHFASLKAYNIGCAFWTAEKHREAEIWIGQALRLIGMCPAQNIPKQEADTISKAYSRLLEDIGKRH